MDTGSGNRNYEADMARWEANEPLIYCIAHWGRIPLLDENGRDIPLWPHTREKEWPFRVVRLSEGV